MSDIQFDIDTMDFVIKDGDLVITGNPSEQNGGLFLYTKNCFLSQPLAGIGINQITNAGIEIIQSELNRWQTQVLNDGARKATWKIDNSIIRAECDYTK
jgi:hypothetical protein